MTTFPMNLRGVSDSLTSYLTCFVCCGMISQGFSLVRSAEQ